MPVCMTGGVCVDPLEDASAYVRRLGCDATSIDGRVRLLSSASLRAEGARAAIAVGAVGIEEARGKALALVCGSGSVDE